MYQTCTEYGLFDRLLKKVKGEEEKYILNGAWGGEGGVGEWGREFIC